MCKIYTAILLIAACALSTGTTAKNTRNTVVRHAFVKANACPATGLHRLPCAGWHIDHIEPLCAGGLDRLENLQWLTVQDHKAKTLTDVRWCRAMKGQATVEQDKKRKIMGELSEKPN